MTSRIYAGAFLIGLLFALGLGISGMMNPQKVQGFLDLTGRWDPSLALVMGGALLVSSIAFPWLLKQPHPLWAQTFALPTKKQVDWPLIVGATLFGIGWGLSGICPGPGLANLASGNPGIVWFVVAMTVGFWLNQRLMQPKPRPEKRETL